MLILGIVLIIVALIGVVWGAVNVTSASYSPPFASAEAAANECKKHEKVLGTPAGTVCGVVENGVCRKGVVNEVGNKCVAQADHLGPGIIAGSLLVLVTGIVCCFLKTNGASQKADHHKGAHKKK